MRFFFILLFIVSLVGGVVAHIPLLLVLKSSGVADQGIGWRQARGTIWNGQMTGLAVNGLPAGHAEVKLRPSELLATRASFDAQWSAPFGKGVAVLSAAPNEMAIADSTIEIDLSRAPIADARLQQLGAYLRAEKVSVLFGEYGCKTASGTIMTDVVKLAGQQYGRTWPELSGPVRCDNRTLIADLRGDGRAGETFRISARIDATGQFNYIIDANGVDFEAQAALTRLGFQTTNSGLSYGGGNEIGNGQ